MRLITIRKLKAQLRGFISSSALAVASSGGPRTEEKKNIKKTHGVVNTCGGQLPNAKKNA